MALDMNAAVKISATVNGQSAVDQLRNSMDKMSGSAASLAKTFAAGFIGLQSIQGIATFAKYVLDGADKLDEMAQRTGLTVEQLSELDYAAKLSGTSIDSVQTAMGKLAVKATEAASGNKTAAVAFDALGISINDSNGKLKSQLQLFEEVGQGISAINDPTLRAALAIEVFGKSGAQLLPLLQDMNALRKEARELGGVVGTEFAANAARFNDNLDRMALLSKGLAKSILSDLIPSVNRLMETMIEASKSGGFFDMLGAGMKQFINNSAVDYVNIDNSISDISKKIANLKQMRDDLTKDTFANRINNAIFGDVATIDSQLKNFEQVLNQLNEIKRKAAEANKPVNDSAADASARKALDALSKANKATLGLTDAQKEAKRQEEERARIIEQLTDSVYKLREGEDALTIAKLKKLGATDKEIEAASKLIGQQAVLQDAAERQKELDKQTQDRIRETTQAAEKLATESARVFESTRTPFERYEDELERLKQLYDAGGLSAETFAKAQKKAFEDLQSVGASVFNETRTPLERYNEELVRLNDLLRGGAISYDTYQRAVEMAENKMNDMGKTGATVFKELENAVLGFGKQSTDAFVEFVSGAEVSFGNLAVSILKDIAKMAIYMTVTKPLFSWLGGFLPGGVTPSADGNIFTGGNVTPFANGGVVTGPTIFPMANGAGLMGEAGPEAIMPLQRTPSGKLGVIAQGSGVNNNVTVNVNVESGQTTTQADNQQADKLGGYIAKAVQAELLKQKRPGGILFAGA